MSWWKRTRATDEGVFVGPLFTSWPLPVVALWLALMARAWFANLSDQQTKLIAPVVFLVAVVFHAFQRWRLRRFAGRGKPIVAAFDGQLWVATGTAIKQISLASIERVIWFGGPRRSLCVLERSDARHTWVIPWENFGRRAYGECAHWSQTILARHVLVIVEAPQSLFASLRQDGPTDESLGIA